MGQICESTVLAPGLARSSCDCSLTKEVMVDDRLVTMQVRQDFFLCSLRSTQAAIVVGYCGSGALPVPQGRVLSRSRLLRVGVRCQ